MLLQIQGPGGDGGDNSAVIAGVIVAVLVVVAVIVFVVVFKRYLILVTAALKQNRNGLIIVYGATSAKSIYEM